MVETIMDESSAEKVEFAKHIYSVNQEILQMADTKSSIILGISGIIISIIIATDLGTVTTEKHYYLVGAIAFSLLTSLSQFYAIFPRLSKNSNRRNILFYKGILQFNRNEYEEELKKLDSSALLNDYINNIYNLALIQEKKYFWLKIGFVFLILSIVFISISFFADTGATDIMINSKMNESLSQG